MWCLWPDVYRLAAECRKVNLVIEARYVPRHWYASIANFKGKSASCIKLRKTTQASERQAIGVIEMIIVYTADPSASTTVRPNE